MSDPSKELAELVALRDAATTGPWTLRVVESEDSGDDYVSRQCWIQANDHPGFKCVYTPNAVNSILERDAAFIASIHRAIALAQRLQAEMEASRKEALEDAANKFDGTTGYNWTAADGYANAFEIAAELRYMASEIPNAAIKAQQETKHEG